MRNGPRARLGPVTSLISKKEVTWRGISADFKSRIRFNPKNYQGMVPRKASRAIGSVWRNPDGNVNVPILNENDDKRNLNLNWNDPDNRWNANYRFVVVSKFLHCARLI